MYAQLSFLKGGDPDWHDQKISLECLFWHASWLFSCCLSVNDHFKMPGRQRALYSLHSPGNDGVLYTLRKAMMLDLTNGNRASLKTLRALETDGNGREVFIGLSRGESERYQFLSSPLREYSLREHLDFLNLDTKHLDARALQEAGLPSEPPMTSLSRYSEP